MRDYRSEFITWYFNEFKQSEMFAEMTATVENSGWHREKNVGVHTDMVVGQYISMTESYWSKEELLGAFACAFHDVGKPIAEEEKTNNEGVVYRRYVGHEKSSAREFENWAAQNWDMLSDRFGFIANDLWATGWVIEHHLPYGVKKKEKVTLLLSSAYHAVGLDVFFTVLRADCWGRISDDHDTKKDSVEEFVVQMLTLWTDEIGEDIVKAAGGFGHRVATMRPTVYLMIGPSHSGKSTYLREKFTGEDTVEVFSWDKLRTEWYGDDYSEAFRLSCADNEFKNKSLKVYNDMLKTGVNVAVDNMNLSAKGRRNFVTDAKRKGYRVVAVMFPIARDVLFARVGQREELPVPLHAVKGHYEALQQPYRGEVDDVHVVTSNF